MRKDFKSDSIVLKIDTGHNYAGNGGDGYNSGNITNNPTMNLTTFNSVEGAHVDIGSQSHHKALWDAPAAPASGVTANTTATQTNMVWADQSQYVSAGNGGEGGDHAKAIGGDVNFGVDDPLHSS